MAKRKKKTIRKPIQVNGFIMVDVDNPSYNPAHEGAAGNPTKATAIYNPKESPAAWMRKYGKMTDPQYQAATKFRRLYERTGGAGVKAFDYTQTAVDGGAGASDGLTQGRMDAAKELAFIHDKLGHPAYELVSWVCGELVWMKDIEVTKRLQKQRTLELYGYLEIIASIWGFQSTIRNWRAA